MDAYRKAQDLLARRPHFVAELRKKLQTRGFPAEDVEASLGRLMELGYLDDLAHGRQLAREYLWRRGYGRLMIIQRLRRKGVEPSLARRITDELFAAVAPVELEELFSRLVPKAGRDLYAYLYRRGFLPEEIEPFVARSRQEDVQDNP